MTRECGFRRCFKASLLLYDRDLQFFLQRETTLSEIREILILVYTSVGTIFYFY